MKLKNLMLVSLAAVSGLSISAHAALPTEATAAFTALSDSVGDVTDAVWPILAAVTAAFALMKLFKKGASRAI
jgi:hypothetical protein